jgi:hypothetical protein
MVTIQMFGVKRHYCQDVASGTAKLGFHSEIWADWLILLAADLKKR